jgi:hypothetical protein
VRERQVFSRRQIPSSVSLIAGRRLHSITGLPIGSNSNRPSRSSRAFMLPPPVKVLIAPVASFDPEGGSPAHRNRVSPARAAMSGEASEPRFTPVSRKVSTATVVA